MANINDTIERKLLPLANKMSSWRYLKAIRDSFLTLLPISLTGGIASVLGAAPFPKEEAEGFLYLWAVFAENANFILTWINTVTIGGLSLYFGIGITYYLCRHYKINPFTPLLVNIVGFLMLVVGPQELGWAATIADLSYIGGKGLVPAMIVSIFTVEAYRFLTNKNFGRIKMPPSVPPATRLLIWCPAWLSSACSPWGSPFSTTWEPRWQALCIRSSPRPSQLPIT